MCMKEQYKELREQLEEYLLLLKIPRWQWHSSSLLLATLEALRHFGQYRNNLITIKNAKDLIVDIYYS